MCTSLTYLDTTNQHYFARTMDFPTTTPWRPIFCRVITSGQRDSLPRERRSTLFSVVVGPPLTLTVISWQMASTKLG